MLKHVWRLLSHLVIVPVLSALVWSIGAYLALSMAWIVPMLGTVALAALGIIESDPGVFVSYDFLKGYFILGGGIIGVGYGVYEGIGELRQEYPALDQFLGGQEVHISRVVYRQEDPDLDGALPGFCTYLNERQILPREGDSVALPNELECSYGYREDGEIRADTVIVRPPLTGIVSGIMFSPHSNPPGVTVFVKPDKPAATEIIKRC
jgi:hypothetical protein